MQYSANFDAKETKIFKTHDCLHCDVSFTRTNDLVLNKKSKHSRPNNLSVRIIFRVSTADVDSCKSVNSGASGVSSQEEAINNSLSTTLDNGSADRASGERAQSINSESSSARRNGVVSTGDMTGNGSYMNQETSVELYGPVEDYNKE